MTESGTERDGWVREEIVAGMGTVGMSDQLDTYLGMGGGYKCRHCDHFIPIEALDDDTCPRCENSGMIGTVIQGRQEVTAMYPKGWFDDDECNVQAGKDRSEGGASR